MWEGWRRLAQRSSGGNGEKGKRCRKSAWVCSAEQGWSEKKGSRRKNLDGEPRSELVRSPLPVWTHVEVNARKRGREEKRRGNRLCLPSSVCGWNKSARPGCASGVAGLGSQCVHENSHKNSQKRGQLSDSDSGSTKSEESLRPCRNSMMTEFRIVWGKREIGGREGKKKHSDSWKETDNKTENNSRPWSDTAH